MWEVGPSGSMDCSCRGDHRSNVVGHDEAETLSCLGPTGFHKGADKIVRFIFSAKLIQFNND